MRGLRVWTNHTQCRTTLMSSHILEILYTLGKGWHLGRAFRRRDLTQKVYSGSGCVLFKTSKMAEEAFTSVMRTVFAVMEEQKSDSLSSFFFTLWFLPVSCRSRDRNVSNTSATRQQLVSNWSATRQQHVSNTSATRPLTCCEFSSSQILWT